MKESIGYTLSLNIMFIFITIVITFLCSALIYFKSNKASNVIRDSIERYEGYNAKAEKDIVMKLSSLGYNEIKITCASKVESNITKGSKCDLVKNTEYIKKSKEKISYASGEKGYCVYYCDESDYYYYRIETNMMINIPIINNVLNIPIITNTERLYKFG